MKKSYLPIIPVLIFLITGCPSAGPDNPSWTDPFANANSEAVTQLLAADIDSEIPYPAYYGIQEVEIFPGLTITEYELRYYIYTTAFTSVDITFERESDTLVNATLVYSGINTSWSAYWIFNAIEDGDSGYINMTDITIELSADLAETGTTLNSISVFFSDFSSDIPSGIEDTAFHLGTDIFDLTEDILLAAFKDISAEIIPEILDLYKSEILD